MKDGSYRAVIRHILRVVIILIITLILPLSFSPVIKAWVRGDDTDALSSATEVVEAPSGRYVALINRKLHTDKDNLLIWRDFFEGKDIPVIFEDINVSVASSDKEAYDMAISLMSRLPENQLKIVRDDATLILSKARYDKYDVLLFSEEMADIYGVDELYEKPQTELIRIGSLP